MTNPPKKVIILSLLIILFIIYSLLVYTRGTKSPAVKMTDIAVKGKLVWQEYNCIACHQIYGLGGYIGPDLTNAISAKGKGEYYVKAVLKNGLLNMPDFRLTGEEIDALVAYLAYIDKTGKFPASDANMAWYGSYQLTVGN
ncbi:MAG: cytochrome c [Cytophagales bacterium]|nr:cytochrome c [Cytophagales bacterium]